MSHKLSSEHPIQNIELSLLQAAVESSRSPLIITDNQLPDNPIIYSNQAFEELSGYAMKDIIGENCRFLQGKDSDQNTIKALRDAVKTGSDVRVTLKNYKKDGTPFWNDLLVSPIKAADGTVTHFIGMQLDITERIESANALQHKTDELEQFAYAASHDLQEPLRMISSYLQLIQRRYAADLDKDAQTFLNFATEGAERMQSLIYDLLSLSRVSTHQEKMMPIDLDKVVERALFNLKLAIEENKAEVSVRNLPRLSVDSVQLTLLFQNLVGNALKYRKKAVSPKITISAELKGDDYVFAVQDNGIGISSRYHKRVFQVFQRLHTKAEYPGTGVGLAICSKIVDRHGGRIWVESTDGSGSTFYFTLPINRNEASS